MKPLPTFKLPPSIASELALALRGHRTLIAIIALYAVATYLLCQRVPPQRDAVAGIVALATTFLIGPAFLLCAYAIYVMVFLRPARLTLYLIQSIGAYLTWARILNALPVLVLVPVFASSFSIFKSAITVLHPFAWDVQLAEWDRMLHGGVHPWEWLHYLLGTPVVTAAVNWVYQLWFFIMFALVYWLAFTLDRQQLRMQYLLTFVVTWIILGTAGALLLSSAGPCYYGSVVGGPNPYAPLMSYLQAADQQVPVLALDVQKLLWDSYQYRGERAPGIGISAMPSMHVGSSVLFALLGWRLGRAAGIALTAFAVVIMIGSVHLGWHYAIDGYVGAAGTYAIWRAIGWLQARVPGAASLAPQSATGTAHTGQQAT